MSSSFEAVHAAKLPSGPPVAPEARPPHLSVVSNSEAASATATAANGAAHNRVGSKRGRRIGAFAVAGAAALIAGGGYLAFGQGGGGENPDTAPAAVTETNPYDGEACPEGMFVGGLYEASLAVSTPGDLHTQPAKTLNTAEELTGYAFEQNGVACDSVLTLAVTKAAMNSVAGEGAAMARGFDVFGSIDEQVEIYKNDPAAAEKDAQMLADLMVSYSGLNADEIVGTYQKVVGVQNGDVVTAAVEPLDVTFPAESVFVVAPQGDVAKSNNTFLIDPKTGQYYLLNNIGLAEAPKDQEQAEGQANQEDAEGQSDQGANGGGGSGSKEGKGGGKGGSENGCDGDCGEGGQESGNGSGAGNGGGEECADGCGPSGTTPGTTPGTTGPRPTNPPATTPPATNPPTTKPPVTPPTTRPKGPEPTSTLPPEFSVVLPLSLLTEPKSRTFMKNLAAIRRKKLGQ